MTQSMTWDGDMTLIRWTNLKTNPVTLANLKRAAMTDNPFAEEDRQLREMIRACREELDKARAELAAMTDDSQPDVQPPLDWWTYDPLTDSQPADAGYVWAAPIGPTPEQAKEAEQDRLWRLVVGTARGA